MEIRVKTLNPIALTCALALLLVLSAATTAAQSVTGSMFGSVLDSTGSAVQGAQLKLVHSATGAERAALTDARGEFAISALGPGQYSLTVPWSPPPYFLRCSSQIARETDRSQLKKEHQSVGRREW